VKARGCSDCSLQQLIEAALGLRAGRKMLASFLLQSDVDESSDKSQSSKLSSRNRSVFCLSIVRTGQEGDTAMEQNRLFQLEGTYTRHPVQLPDHCRADQKLKHAVEGSVQMPLQH